MSNSKWCSSSFRKLLFFARLRRLLRRKMALKKVTVTKTTKNTMELEMDQKVELTVVEGNDEGEISSFVMQRSVKKLLFGEQAEQEAAAREIGWLAAEDLSTRKSIAGLGVIPALVSMLDSESAARRRSAIRALIELGNGTHTNKVLMVEAGIVTKMSRIVTMEDPLCTSELVTLLQSLSTVATAAANTIFSPAPEILRFLDQVLNSDHINIRTKLACLMTLHHFSTLLHHNTTLVSSGSIIHTLIRLSSHRDMSEQALATLSNLVVSVAGKQAVEVDPCVPDSFIEVLTWEDKPKCQELALYILMILANGSSSIRGKMAKSGIVQVLLGVVLLGSPLAQKRAMKILQWFRDEKQRKIGPHSGPQTGWLLIGLQMDVGKEIEQGRMAIKHLVKQSLDKNMELIMRRAHQSDSPDASKIKSLILSSSSKSLAY